MGRFRIIPVFILTRDRRSGFELKRYLEEEAGFPFPVVAEVYFSTTELIPHLSIYDTNYIVTDYNEYFLEELQSVLELPANLIYQHQIILRSPSEHLITGSPPPNSTGFPVIRDFHDFQSVAKTMHLLLKSVKKQNAFLEANYVLAGLLMMIVVVLAIFIL